jgi:hypothetical protein
MTLAIAILGLVAYPIVGVILASLIVPHIGLVLTEADRQGVIFASAVIWPFLLIMGTICLLGSGLEKLSKPIWEWSATQLGRNK